jgi:hypothetical protein
MLDVEGRAIAGAPLTLRVMPQTSPMSVALQNGSGETLAERAIAAGTTRISVPLPQEPATYFLVLRYDRNGSEETVVRPLRTFAAGAQTSSR